MFGLCYLAWLRELIRMRCFYSLPSPRVPRIPCTYIQSLYNQFLTFRIPYRACGTAARSAQCWYLQVKTARSWSAPVRNVVYTSPHRGRSHLRLFLDPCQQRLHPRFRRMFTLQFVDLVVHSFCHPRYRLRPMLEGSFDRQPGLWSWALPRRILRNCSDCKQQPSVPTRFRSLAG